MVPRRARQAGLALLTVLVTLFHLGVAERVEQSRLDRGAAERMPRRLEVSFVRELLPQAPPAVPPRVLASPRPARRAAAVAIAASAPPEPLPEALPEVRPEVPPDPPPDSAQVEPPAPLASAAQVAEAASAAPAELAALMAEAAPSAASAAAPTAFDWPASTRLEYRLTGNFRGPIDGRASVEWLRVGARYQVRLEVSAGPGFAPFFTRRMSSDGEVSERGLTPQRYDEETKVALRDPRRIELRFEGDSVRLADGRLVARPEGVQDAASQFVQMTWMFTTRPELLRRGGVVEIPLALPRSVGLWAYEVLDRETLETPLGALEAVHVKPRRLLRPGGDLVAESWFAPSLQYLPVRIVIRQDDQTWIDLMIERAPLQAAPETAPAQLPLKRVP
jgi:hypothetical protein